MVSKTEVRDEVSLPDEDEEDLEYDPKTWVHLSSTLCPNLSTSIKIYSYCTKIRTLKITTLFSPDVQSIVTIKWRFRNCNYCKGNYSFVKLINGPLCYGPTLVLLRSHHKFGPNQLINKTNEKSIIPNWQMYQTSWTTHVGGNNEGNRWLTIFWKAYSIPNRN